MVKFTSKLKLFLHEPGTSFLCAVVAVVVILCVVYRNYCFFLVSLFSFFLFLLLAVLGGALIIGLVLLCNPFSLRDKIISIQLNLSVQACF